jgi:tRNA-specific 2-thiouridylase
MARVIVAMSGGIDSSVAAHLLKEEGHDIVGVFMRNGIHAHRANQKSCCSIEDAYDARRVADQLRIPFYAVNFREGFASIIDYFVSEYTQGRTPNPCVICNRDLKFGRLFEYAHAVQAEYVATGHYAQVDRGGGRPALRRGADASKDQSYMLFSIQPRWLRKILFPVGGIPKSQVREIARGLGWAVADKPDSQEICFVPNDDYRTLIRDRAPDAVRPGEIRTQDGRVVGTHDGCQNFTIGQRKGLGTAFGKRMYVTGIDPDTNTVTVGEEKDLYRSTARVAKVNWLSIEPPAPGASLRASVKIRYQHEAAAAEVRVLEGERAEVVFDRPQKMVTPGQGAAFYDGEVVLGGGWIESAGPGQ